METRPKINAQLDDPAVQTSQVCLGTPVILRQILQQFSNSELLKLSFVNKQWNFEARSVLRNRGTLTARFRSDDPPCQGLEALASDLRQMRVVPFSGIRIRLSHGGDDACQPNGSLDHFNDDILELLSWKTLSVDFQDNWTICKDCPALVLVAGVLENFCGALEQVSLTLRWDDLDLFQHVHALLNRSSFPRLKTVKLDIENINPRLHLVEFVKMFVAHAPKLQDLHFIRSLDLDENILEGRSTALAPHCRFSPLYEPVCQSLIGNLRATEMVIQRGRFMDFDVELLDRFIPMVLQASRTTLQTLRMDLLFALPLMCYGIRLKSVTSLEIRMDGRWGLLRSPPPWTTKFLLGFNFSRVFPKLTQDDILNDAMCSISADEVFGFEEQGNAVLRKTLPDRAIRIQQLTFRRHNSNYTNPILAQIFPHVKTISVFESQRTSAIPFTFLWGHYMYLRELKVVITSSPQEIDNLDGIFCGIFPEEVAELREKDDEFLKAVNIVPVMPSITCMKDLRALSVRYTPDAGLPTETDTTFMFSKVTGLIGFARCPALAVTFETLSHECAEGELWRFVLNFSSEF